MYAEKVHAWKKVHAKIIWIVRINVQWRALEFLLTYTEKIPDYYDCVQFNIRTIANFGVSMYVRRKKLRNY